ncbi:MAG TPA: SH3 domain-containing protein [Arenicellales bacterium]|nr:SH3 domain-containing protein [Arenicellales bacterium]
MKRLATIIALCAGLAAGPVMADHNGRNLLNRENIGGAIGAALGGLAANKIVEGKGQSAATAAGAVGGFLIGKNIAHNYGGSQYRDYGYSQSYQAAPSYQPTRSYAPAPAYRDTRSYDPAPAYRDSGGYSGGGCCSHDRGTRYSVRPIDAAYVAECTSNVRSGPGTRYRVIDQLYEHERVRVTGKVRGRDWYQVRIGHRTGYVYAPLLRPAHYAYSGYR